MGRHKVPVGKQPQLKVQRVCGADGCGKVTRGTDLLKHYRNKTDFTKLKELKNMSIDAAEIMVKTVDLHTRFMFENGYWIQVHVS